MIKNGFSVDLETMDAVTRQMDSDLEQLRGRLAEVQSEMTALNAKWEGPANRSFQSNFSRDYQNMVDEMDLLRQELSVLAEAHTTYATCEAKVHDRIAALRM